jgi:hypothetical protein
MSTHIVFLAETEKATDLGRTLGTQALGVDGIRQTRDVRISLLDDRESENRQVHGDDASTNRLSLSLTSSAGAVAAVTIGEEKADTSRVHDTLLHRETLLVVASSDAENVALELVADAVARDFLTHATVHEDTELALIFDLDQLLRAVGRV